MGVGEEYWKAQQESFLGGASETQHPEHTKSGGTA